MVKNRKKKNMKHFVVLSVFLKRNFFSSKSSIPLTTFVFDYFIYYYINDAMM